jgi:multiple sugar transport system permease protein
MNGMRMGPIARVARHIVLMAGGIVMIAPFAIMVLTSFKPQGEILTAEFHLLPERWALIQNYAAATQKVSLLHYMLNGLIVTASIFTLQVLTSLPAAYALAKLRFWGRDALFGLVLLCLLVPMHATAIPIYILFYKTGILNTYGALILPFALSVFGIFLMRQFFMTVPDDLIDAARIDGMRDFGIVWRVMLPTAVPALIAFGIFSVIAHWNDYFWPLIAVGNERLFTPPLGVAFFKENGGGTDYGPLMAAATVTILPLVAAFLIAQRRFIEGITFSGMKG